MTRSVLIVDTQRPKQPNSVECVMETDGLFTKAANENTSIKAGSPVADADYDWKATDEVVNEILDGAVVLEPREEFHQAIIGYADSADGSDAVAVYSVTKILDYLQKSMTYEEAQDYFDFNTVRAIPYMGPRRPVLVYDIPL